MSDDRLFASNNAIGRKWYCLNLLILALITYGTYWLFDTHIIPNVTTNVYELIAKWFLYFALAIYLITFFALIERRLYDVIGTRESKTYRNLSSSITLCIFVIALDIYSRWKNPSLPIPQEMISLIATGFGIIFILIAIVLAFLKGTISNLTYEEYRRKIKYE